MPFNGSGIFSFTASSVAPAVTDTTISSADFNLYSDEIATALTLCVTKDGQTSSPLLTTPNINESVDTTATSTEINLLDGATVTTAEINNIDGVTAATATTVATGDRVVYNDAGVMKQVNVDDVDTYFSQTTKTLTNKELTSPVINTPTITADSEAITSGGSPVYGLVVLDTPEILYSGAAPLSVWTSSSGLPSTTLTTASAKKAIIAVSWWCRDSVAGVGQYQSYFSLRKAGTIVNILYSKIAEAISNNIVSGSKVTRLAASGSVVNLDVNFDFEYYCRPCDPTLTDNSLQIMLVGYYV